MPSPSSALPPPLGRSNPPPSGSNDPAPPPGGSDAPPPGSSDPPPLPPDLSVLKLPWVGLDRPGILQALGGLILGLIALLSSYDHLSIAGFNLPLPQQWGIPCIAASVATVFVDAQLATRSRLRAERRAARAADEAAEERDRAAEARERQGESLERLDQAALLSARIQLDPSAANRERLRIFLALRQQALEDGEAWGGAVAAAGDAEASANGG